MSQPGLVEPAELMRSTDELEERVPREGKKHRRAKKLAGRPDQLQAPLSVVANYQKVVGALSVLGVQQHENS